jgi:hypothetical protein
VADYNLKVGWITTSDSVKNAYLLHSDVILQIQARWITGETLSNRSTTDDIIRQYNYSCSAAHVTEYFISTIICCCVLTPSCSGSADSARLIVRHEAI